MKTTSLRTLVVDDETNIRLFYRLALEKAGHTVVEAENGVQALELIRESCFDVAVLDLNLGGKIDGQRVLEGIRWRWPETIVIILTGYGTLQSSLAAIREGVDGYLLKPVDDHELLQTIEDARQRMQRRSKETASNPVAPAAPLVAGDLSLDPALYRLYLHGQTVELSLHEYRLMHCLISNPGRVVTVRELVRAVQQFEPESEVEAREIIKWYIHRLRKKIEPDMRHPHYLLNVRGIGYRLGG